MNLPDLEVKLKMDTSDFDQQMRKVRRQFRSTQRDVILAGIWFFIGGNVAVIATGPLGAVWLNVVALLVLIGAAVYWWRQ